MQTKKLTRTLCSRRRGFPTARAVLGAGLLAASIALPLNVRAATRPERPVPVTGEGASGPRCSVPAPGRNLLLVVTAVLGSLVGIERLASWRLGVRHRREGLDVMVALWPTGGGRAVPIAYPVTWSAPPPGHRYLPQPGSSWGGSRGLARS